MKSKHKLTNLFLFIFFSSIFSFLIPFSTYAFSPSSNQIYQGIDISSWQGNVNFANVKNSGIDIVYIKSSEGTTYINPYFESSYSNAKTNGLKVGFYHYVRARTTNQAINEANFFARVISGK